MRMNWAKWLEWAIEKHRVITNVVGTVLLSWFLSGIAAHFIGFLIPKPKTSSMPSPSSQVFNDTQPSLAAFGPKDFSHYIVICERNLFDSQKKTACVDEVALEEEVDPNAPPVKSDLPVTLLGTMVFTNPLLSFATISPSGGGDSKNYRIDDMISGEGKVYDIQRNKVFITRKGRKEYIAIDKLPSAFGGDSPRMSAPESAEGIRVNGDKVTLTRSKVDATLGDLNKVIQDSRMYPNIGPDGKVNGFKVAAIRKGSIFEQLGIKNGDVIHKINGTAIDSIEKALPMLQLLKSESSISIDMTRGGSAKTMSIDIQ